MEKAGVNIIIESISTTKLGKTDPIWTDYYHYKGFTYLRFPRKELEFCKKIDAPSTSTWLYPRSYTTTCK